MGKAQAQLSGARETDSRQIQHEIEMTRVQMDRTVDELSSQLSPRRFLNDLLDRFGGGQVGSYLRSEATGAVRSGASSAGKWLMRGIGRHPLPSAVIGSGVAWLIMDWRNKREQARQYRYSYEQLEPEPSGEMMMSTEPGFEKTTSPELGDEMEPGYCPPGETPASSKARVSEAASRTKKRVSQTASNVSAKASQTASKVSSKVSETAGKVSDWSREKYRKVTGKTGEAREKISDQASRMRQQMKDRFETGWERTSELIDEYPLIVGVSAMAVGLVIGLLIPPSRQERRFLGPRASRLRERAEDLVERGKEAVKSTAEAVKEEARRQGLTPSELKESIREVTRRAGAAAKEEGLSKEGIADRIEAVAEEGTETMKREMGREENR